MSAELDPTIVGRIKSSLSNLAREHEVAIPLAIESGSRAWGFPSPDSDYDCRFIFVRPDAHYLSPWPRRDVIELPVDKVFDVNGWDLVKAIKLLAKGNAVVIEWLTSPIVYGVDEGFRSDFLALARKIARRDLVARHYLHLGVRQRATYFDDPRSVPVKKLFYALRPAAALRWLRLHEREAVAPMHFPTLMAQCDPPTAIAAITRDLMARKARTRELGEAPLPREIARFVDDEFEAAKTTFAAMGESQSPDARIEAEQFFRETVARLGAPRSR